LRAGMPGDSGVLVVTRVRSTTTKCTRGRGCNGHPAFPTPSVFRGERFINDSGVARRGVAKSCLDSFCCLKRIKLVCAKLIRRASPHKTHPSCPDLIRASINLRHNFFRRKMVHRVKPGDDDLNRYDVIAKTLSKSPAYVSRRRPRRLPAPHRIEADP
jgi:hypothetical protein